MTPSTRVKQPKIRSQGSNMPTVAEDIFGIWGEIWGEIERDGTHIRKKFDCSKQNISGVFYMFFAVFRIWAQARHLALAKIQMVQSMPAVCLPKWSNLFGAIFSERVR
jgi:hypothetical protein